MVEDVRDGWRAVTGLDLKVDGDVDSVRGTADGMSSLGNALDDAGAGFGQASAESESLWQGTAGDAFRSRIGTARQAATQAVAATRRMSSALHVFADRMATVKAEVARAKSIAEGAGLQVGGDTIQPPKPPPAPPAACYTPQGAAEVARQQAAAEAKYRKQVKAFQQAEKILTQARKDEQNAHQDVGKAADEEKSVLEDLNEHKFWLLGGVTVGAVATGLEQRVTWQQTMEQLGLEYDRLRTDAAAATDPILRTSLSEAAQDTLDRASRAADATVDNARIGLGADPASGAGKLLDHLPAGLAGVQGVWDVTHAQGTKGKVIAGASDAAAYGVGEGVTAIGSGVIEGLAIGGAPETLGLSLVAGGAAYGTGYLVQHYGPAAYDWTSNAAGNVAHAVTHPGDTISSLAGDIGL
jgi:uncharacterized protein YukE